MTRKRHKDVGAWSQACATVAFALALWVPAGHAAEVTAVRVALHADFVRIVFESDTPLRYRLPAESVVSGDRFALWLDASSALDAASIAGDDSPFVRLKAALNGGTNAWIRLDRSASIRSEVLANPHRLVVDLFRPLPGEALADDRQDAAMGAAEGGRPEADGSAVAPSVAVEDFVESPGPEPEQVDVPAVSAGPAGSLAAERAAPNQSTGEAGDGFGLPRAAVATLLSLAVFLSLIVWLGSRRRLVDEAPVSQEKPVSHEKLRSPSHPSAPTPSLASAATTSAPVREARPVAAPALAATLEGSSEASPPNVDLRFQADLLAMLRRIDSRVAALEAKLSSVEGRQEDAASRREADRKELGVHRAALARFQRLVRPSDRPGTS